ncbi:MAG: DUF512 domain-containing protein [Armatimonadota bacterium]
MKKQNYGKISYVEEESPAYNAGIVPGDELVSINSRAIVDVLDCSYLSSEEKIDIEIQRDGKVLEFAINKDEDEDLGIEFEEELFDGLRSCKNSCIFCFLKQMPKGMRDTLYMRDDDYRLSFAQGNYITLTNLSDDDMTRIISQRMGPLYISVQTTDPDLRVKMLKNPNAAKVMDQLRAFADARITMHTQIVLCPGINDGEYLEKSVRDLASLSPWVESIAIVPVGLTKYRDDLDELHPVDSILASDVINSCTKWQKEFKKAHGTRLVYVSDEFYLLAGIDFPGKAAYEEFPQFENGVGISRTFIDELKLVEKRISRLPLKPGKYVLVTGTLAAPLVTQLADLLNQADGVHARLCITMNKFFGKTVTVAGLLTGQDIICALKDTDEKELILIPDVALNGDKFLDDVTISEVGRLACRNVAAVSVSPLDVIRYLKA